MIKKLNQGERLPPDFCLKKIVHNLNDYK